MMYAYSGFGDVPTKATLASHQATDIPLTTKTACMAAVRAHQYPTVTSCYDAVRAGAPVPTLDAPVTAAEASADHTKLYVGVAIAVAVVGVGGYLLFK
jgi:hypothetical protein